MLPTRLPRMNPPATASSSGPSGPAERVCAVRAGTVPCAQLASARISAMPARRLQNIPRMLIGRRAACNASLTCSPPASGKAYSSRDERTCPEVPRATVIPEHCARACGIRSAEVKKNPSLGK